MPLDSNRIRSLLRRRNLDALLPIRIRQTTGSTQDDAFAAIGTEGLNQGTFLADEQTQGQGRERRRWYSPPGRNLYFSVVLSPKNLPSIPRHAVSLPPALAIAG